MADLVTYEDCIFQIKEDNDIFELSERLDSHVFRGQEQDWDIESRLSRILKILDIDKKDYKNREDNVIEEFKAKIGLYKDFNLNTNDYVECCSLMQHYGGPTRLIDFTDSFFVALFFALENMESTKEAVVWGFNEGILIDIHARKVSLNSGLLNYKSQQYKHMVKEANEIFSNENKKEEGLLVIRPTRMNERISIQQGLFLMHENIEKSFIDNYKGFLRKFEEGAKEVTLQHLKENHYNVFVIKIIIPPGRLKRFIRTHLLRMNINHVTLFPGIEGFCKSLAFKIPPRF